MNEKLDNTTGFVTLLNMWENERDMNVKLYNTTKFVTLLNKFDC